MPLDPLTAPLYLCFAAGVGLLVGGLGVVTGFGAGRRGRVRVAAVAGALAVSTAAVADPGLVPVVAAGAVGQVAVAGLVGSPLAAVAVAVVARRAVAGSAVTVAGVAALAAGPIWYDRAVESQYETDLAALDVGEYRGARAEVTDVSAVTDRGTAILLTAPVEARPADDVTRQEKHVLDRNPFAGNLIRRQPADDRCNCHGWVYTGGRYWVPSEQVETILADNGYAAQATPAGGDLVIYRDDSGYVCHTAVVRAVGTDGTVLAEGKWGWLGVYLHEVAASTYGKRFTYYRSPRSGHVLAGLGPVAAE
jgi:hypothetical protein